MVDQAQYVITMDVAAGCEKGMLLVNEDKMGLTGKLQYRAAPQEEIDEKIAADEFVEAGGLVLNFGETVTQQQSGKQLVMFVTDSTFDVDLEG